jgi:hypothetical protein
MTLIKLPGGVYVNPDAIFTVAGDPTTDPEGEPTGSIILSTHGQQQKVGAPPDKVIDVLRANGITISDKS